MIFRRIVAVFLFGTFLMAGIAAPVSVNFQTMEAGMNAAQAAKKDKKAKKSKKDKKAKKGKKAKKAKKEKTAAVISRAMTTTRIAKTTGTRTKIKKEKGKISRNDGGNP